jgi:hypothetical protein
MKNILPFKTILFLLFFAIPVSCKKDANLLTANATIVDTGSIAADGCGWLIKLNDSTTYQAINLSTDYQKNNLQVSISYYLLTTKFQCGYSPPGGGITQIELKSIKQQ